MAERRRSPTLGRIGAWAGLLAGEPASTVREAAARLERSGYKTIWYGESVSREALAFAALLLSATNDVTVASGIANLWARDASAMINGGRTLAEAWDDRFVLGIGVSHAPLVDGRGHHYTRPLAATREYLDAMERARWIGPVANDPPVVLAALGPRMLELAAERTAGAHPYFVPVEHTGFAREIVGPDAILAPEQAVVVSQDPATARAAARDHMKTYLRMRNYRSNLLRLGWTEGDLDAVPDELVDAIVAWGTTEAIVDRVAAHLRAGADHVAVQILPSDGSGFPVADYVRIAPALLEAGGDG